MDYIVLDNIVVYVVDSSKVFYFSNLCCLVSKVFYLLFYFIVSKYYRYQRYCILFQGIVFLVSKVFIYKIKVYIVCLVMLYGKLLLYISKVPTFIVYKVQYYSLLFIVYFFIYYTRYFKIQGTNCRYLTLF